MRSINVFLLVLLLFPASSFAAHWADFNGQHYGEIVSNYLESYDPSTPSTMANTHRLVLVMNAAFHNCGWNTVGEVVMHKAGEEAFQSLTGALLAAWMGNKKVALLIHGCHGNRAIITGLRIAK